MMRTVEGLRPGADSGQGTTDKPDGVGKHAQTRKMPNRRVESRLSRRVFFLIDTPLCQDGLCSESASHR